MPGYPFTMQGTLQESLLFNFSVPAETVRPLVPEPLQLVTYRGYAFWNVCAVRFRHLRPWPLPRFLGASYLQVSYRLPVLLETPDGESQRGYYVIRRDVSKWLIAALGNLFGPARLHSAMADLRVEVGEARLMVRDTRHGEADVEARVDVAENVGGLPPGSRFPDFTTAGKVLDCARCDLSYDPLRREVRLARTQYHENAWKMQPVRVLESHWNYLLDPRHGGDAVRAEPAFWIGPAFCRWPRREVLRYALAPVLARPLSAMPLAVKRLRTSSRVRVPAGAI